MDELRWLTPEESGGQYELRIEPAESLEPADKPSWEVWCAKGNDNERYCMSLSPWEEWLALWVPHVLLDTMPEAEMVAHCIWDMTFYGFTQERIAENRAELDRRARAIDEGKAESIPMEQVMARLRAKFGWSEEPHGGGNKADATDAQ